MASGIHRRSSIIDHRRRLKMKQDLFAYLPSEITIDILSTLPIRSIRSSKCVCKPWNALLESGEFVNSHLLKSTPGLAVHGIYSKLFKIFNFEDAPDLKLHKLHEKTVVECHLPFDGRIFGSANGLLFICSWSSHFIIYICNPVTRDYVELPSPIELVYFFKQVVVALGFGVSRITGQYKVVMVLKEYTLIPEPECYVYTVGTGLWRSVAAVDTRLKFGNFRNAAFLNGNLHWLATGSDDPQQYCICCVDLETELYSVFSSPLKKSGSYVWLCVFQGTLCLCDHTRDFEIEIWLMKEYGVEKSWGRQFSIPKFGDFESYNHVVCPIQVFENGDVLIARRNSLLFYYKNNTVQNLDVFEGHDEIEAFLFTPNFVSLKKFEMENARSF